MVSTSALLLITAAVFFGIVALIGYMTEKWIGSNDDYIVAGREVNWGVTGLGVAAIIWAGDFFALFSIFAVVFGFWAAAIGTASLGVGYLMYGTWFSPVARAVGSYTIGEFLEIRFDTKTRILTTVYLGIAMAIFLPAGSLGVAAMLNGFVGWPIIETATAQIILIGIIVLSGGLWGVTVTDIIQAVIGYLALPIILVWALLTFGGIEFLSTSTPHDVFAFPGEFRLDLHPDSYLTWVILWGAMLIYGSPYYWIRAVAARTDKAAKRGFQLAGVMGITLALFVAALPLYAVAISPDVFAPYGGDVPPDGALGVLADAAPLALGLLLMVTIVAANISTYTTTSMGGIASFSRDIYQRLIAPNATPYEMLTPTRIISVLFIIVGWTFVFVGDVVFLLGVLLTFIGISTMVTLAGVASSRVTPDAAFAGALGGGIVAAVWPVFQIDPTIHQIWPTIVATVLPMVIVTPVTEAKYYGKSGWQKNTPTADGGTTSDLSDDERSVLVFISAGANTFSDLIDLLAVDGTEVNKTVERLEQHGHITREGYRGAGLFRYQLTEAGREEVKRDESWELMQVNGLTLPATSLEILRVIDGDDGLLKEDIAEKLDLEKIAIEPHLQVLKRNNLVVARGIFRSIYETSAEGETVARSEASAEDETVAQES